MGWRPLVIAHRGASAVAPESTRAAIREAVRAKADMIELDVQLTRDGHLVVFHDERLERTTNGRGLVRDATLRRLRQLDAGSWFHRAFHRERVLSVSQALRAIPAPMRINLELKRTATPRLLLRQLHRLVRQPRFAHRLLLSSFDARLIRPLPRHGPARGVICRTGADRSLSQAIRLGCASWHPWHELITAARLRRAHAAGLQVYAWTVDDVRCARRLLCQGVDGLFTNDPRRLRRGLLRRSR